jgi:hypothetical protein
MVKKTLLTGALLLSLNSHAKVDTLNEHDSWGGCSGIPSDIERFVLYRGFTRACNTHDWGYTRIGANKQEVDYTLKHNLTKACSEHYSKWNPQYHTCKDTANAMWRLVRNDKLGFLDEDSYAKFKKAQEKGKRLVLEDIAYQGNANYKDISASRPINGYADKHFNIHQPYYFHMIDERFLDVVSKIKSSGRYPINLTNAEVWEMLEDGIRNYVPNKTGEVSLNAWETKWKRHHGWEYLPLPDYEYGCGTNQYECR